MIPVNQFILGGSDPLLYPGEKMTNSIDEQIAFLQSQKQAINEAYRRNAVAAANNGVVQNQQVIPQQPMILTILMVALLIKMTEKKRF